MQHLLTHKIKRSNMENLSNWLVETKPTNKYLAWLLIELLKDGVPFENKHFKWVYRVAINKLRLPNRQYSDRNYDWHKDCTEILKTYRKLYKK